MLARRTDDPALARHALNGRRRLNEGAIYLKLFLLAVVLLQRFAIPVGGGQVALLLPVTLLIFGIAFARGHMRIDPLRAILIALIWVTALVCTLAQVFVGTIPSVLSVALLLVLYVPAIFSAQVGNSTTSSVFRFFVQLMAAAAVVSVAQLVLQYVGVPNVDLIGEYLPEGFVQQGFAPNAFITYGAELRRSNAFIFLEPSFLSLFLGLAVLVAIRLGMNWIWPTVLLAGMVPTLAGNGIVVLLPGLIILAFTPVRRHLGALLPGLTLAVMGAAITPLGALYLGRSTEASSQGSSASFRFVQPYSTLLPASFDDPFHTLFGHGAATAEEYLFGTEITAPAIPKVIYEYGVLGAVGILGALIVLLWIGGRERAWLIGLGVSYLFVNASLLLPVLVLFTIFWTLTLPANKQGMKRRRRPRRSRPVVEAIGPRAEVQPS